MSINEHQHTDGDGRSQVSLAELIALRAKVAHARLPSLASRAMRSGGHSSRLYGRGMDYAESRVYQAGDDVRRMDWRLTARSGKLHTKLFEEDREGSLLILLDTHASMRFGTRRRFKSVQAARVAAVAAWYAVRAGERVGAMTFGRAEQLLRPQRGDRAALAICGVLAQSPASVTDMATSALSQALQRGRRALHGATRILLVSDGFSCDAAARTHLLDLTARTSVGIVLVRDALERGLPPAGRYPVEHAGQRADIPLESERQREDFQRALGAGAQKLIDLAASLRVRCVEVDTVVDPFDAVTAALGVRRPATCR
ncbi:MAG: DUF58 domain-containing protein [Rhodanobacter sp.]